MSHTPPAAGKQEVSSETETRQDDSGLSVVASPTNRPNGSAATPVSVVRERVDTGLGSEATASTNSFNAQQFASNTARLIEAQHEIENRIAELQVRLRDFQFENQEAQQRTEESERRHREELMAAQQRIVQLMAALQRTEASERRQREALIESERHQRVLVAVVINLLLRNFVPPVDNLEVHATPDQIMDFHVPIDEATLPYTEARTQVFEVIEQI